MSFRNSIKHPYKSKISIDTKQTFCYRKHKIPFGQVVQVATAITVGKNIINHNETKTQKKMYHS